MLFRPARPQRIAAGEITLAFRRWERPRVKPGSTQRTPIGVIAFDAVEVVEDDQPRRGPRGGVRDARAGRGRDAAAGPDPPRRVASRGPGPAGRAARDAARRRAVRPARPDGPVDVRVPAADRRAARGAGGRPRGVRRARAPGLQARRPQAQGTRPHRVPEPRLPPLAARSAHAQLAAERPLEDVALALGGPAGDRDVLGRVQAQLDAAVVDVDVAGADGLVARALELLGDPDRGGDPGQRPPRRPRAPATRTRRGPGCPCGGSGRPGRSGRPRAG